jgi:hypothetical protein
MKISRPVLNLRPDMLRPPNDPLRDAHTMNSRKLLSAIIGLSFEWIALVDDEKNAYRKT